MHVYHMLWNRNSPPSGTQSVSTAVEALHLICALHFESITWIVHLGHMQNLLLAHSLQQSGGPTACNNLVGKAAD